jgi:hypothetical protein
MTAPQRYKFDGNRAVPIPDEEKVEAAKAATELPLSEAIGLAKNLLALFADPKSAAASISQFIDAASKASTASDQAKAARADVDRDHAELAEARKQHSETLANERAVHDRNIAQQARDIAGREQAVSDREREAAALLAELEGQREDLRRRLAAIRASAE